MSDQFQRNGDWYGTLLGWCYSQFRLLEYWRAYLSALATMAQAAEDEEWLLVVDCTLEAATGAQLEQWGALVGCERLGLDDGTYRRFIQAQIPIRDCGGTGDEMIDIFAQVCGVDPSLVTLEQLPPASIWLIVYPPVALDTVVESAVVRAMGAAQADGIGMQLVEAPAGAFRLDSTTYGLDRGLLGWFME